MIYNKINIKYSDYDYSISGILPNGLFCILSGDTITNKTFDVNSSGTYFECDPSFITSSQTNDNILITVYNSSGSTIPSYGLTHPAYLNYYTTIDEINGNIIKIDGDIPFNIYNNLSVSGYSYRIRNIHYSEAGINNFVDYINVSAFKDILKAEIVSGEININPESDYKYFDYSLIDITYTLVDEPSQTATTFIFNNDNLYAKYELEPFINNLFSPYQPPINIYNENSICRNEYHIEEIYDPIADNNYDYLNTTWYPIQSSRYKITPDSDHKYRLKNFRPYTYIDFGLMTKEQVTYTYPYYSGGDLLTSSVTFEMNKTPYEIIDSGRTMITEITDNYMIIEKPGLDMTTSGLTGGTGTVDGIIGIYDLVNVAKTSDISTILYRHYINTDYHSYIKKSDSERYRVFGSYGQILTENELIRNNATGILYQDRNDLFNIDIFNININSAYTFDDNNLLYQPIELYDLGIDKKTNVPTTVEINNLIINDEINNWFLSGDTYHVSSLYPENSFIWNSIFYDNKLYTLIEWNDEIIINGIHYNTSGGTTSDNNISLMLLEIENGEILNNNRLFYEWDDSDHKIDNIKLRMDNNKNINLLVTHFDNRDVKNITIKPSNISASTLANNNGSDLLNYDLSANTWDIIQYSANTSISLTDIVFDNSNNKYMLGRYYQETDLIIIDGQELDTENDYSSILIKSNSGGTMLWNKTILQLNGNAITGPIVSQLEIDENNNLYLFGEMTNFDGYTNIQVGDFSSINPIISKPSNENWFLFSKFNSDGTTLWNSIFKGSDNSLFLNPKIIYDNKYIYYSFNFSEDIELNSSITYSTNSDQIINSICGKIDIENGEVICSKFLKSTKSNIISDFIIDENYIYYIGEFKGEGIFDSYNLFSNGETGYVMKMRKRDGVIINIKEIFSDNKLILSKINVDNENIYVSGSWIGNIYIDGNIKYTSNEEFFITNIKKNDI